MATVRFLLSCLIPVLLVSTGCGGSDEPDVASGVPDDDVIGSEETATEGLCTPGFVKECTPDLGSEIVCAEDGQRWESRTCEDDEGQRTQCIEGHCLACTPADKRCKSEDRAERCAEDGSGWEDAEACNGEVTGQVCTQGNCLKLCDVSIKWNSYMGCDYWGADLDNGFVPGPNGGALDAAGAQYAIIVSNPSTKYPADIEIRDWEGLVEFGGDGVQFPKTKLGPRDLRVFKMPRRDVNSTMLGPLAYKVTTSVPTIVYQFNPLEDVQVFSNDASLLLPQHVLDRWYYVMTRMQTFEGIRAYLTVIGTRKETQVTVTVSAHTLPGEGIPALQPGESITRTLNAYDVFNIETDGLGEDLTGSVVLANKSVAVFGGSEGANAPNTDHCLTGEGHCEQDGVTPCESNADCKAFITCCADHIEQQLFPVTSWGTRYLAARTWQRGEEPELWRIMAAVDDTVVKTTPTQANIPTLDAGEFFEFEAMGDFEIEASKPVLVGQFMTAEQAPNPGKQEGDAGIGDPAFMLVPPVEQFRSEYVVLSPPKFELDYINVVAPTGIAVTLDGEVIDMAEFSPVGKGEYSVARLPVSDGVHVLASADESSTFAVLVYGFDQYVSYGYPGGLNLTNLGLVEPP